MRLGLLSGLAAVLALTSCDHTASQSGAPARFQAKPGTNSLAAARDAVRAWHAAGHAAQPAEIRLASGEYPLSEPLTLDSRDSNVWWTAQNPKKVLITGGQRISGFAAGTEGVWRARTGLRFEQLFVNGRRAVRARFPLTGYFRFQEVRQEDATNGRVRLTVKLAVTNAAILQADPAVFRQAQILVFHNWDTSRYRIDSLNPVAGTLSVLGDRMQTWNPWNAQSRFILDNCTGGQPLPPGSWFLDGDGTLTYCPLNGEAIDRCEFIAPVVDHLIRIDGANDVRFTGLQFSHTRYEMAAIGCPPVQAAARQPAAIEINHARNVSFRDCEIAHTGGYGIWFQKGCHDDFVGGCRLDDLGAGGIRIGETEMRSDPADQTDGTIVDNNVIHGCGRVHPSAVGIWIGQSANNQITHNDISDTFYTGVSVGWSWGYGRSLATSNLVAFNRIHRIGQGVLSDMGGIYTLGVSPGSAAIGNVIYDVRAHDYGGWGIYPDEGSTGWRIESNLVWRCTCVAPHSGGGFHQNYGATNLIANNIFALSSGPPIQATRAEDHLSFTFERNLIVCSNADFFTGPWDKLRFESCSNCFVVFGTPLARLFPNGNLAQWQQAGHETGSILTNCHFTGSWPNVNLPPDSPAYSVGFKMFAPAAAGVTDLAGRRGKPGLRRSADRLDTEPEPANAPITTE